MHSPLSIHLVDPRKKNIDDATHLSVFKGSSCRGVSSPLPAASRVVRAYAFSRHSRPCDGARSTCMPIYRFLGACESSLSPPIIPGASLGFLHILGVGLSNHPHTSSYLSGGPSFLVSACSASKPWALDVLWQRGNQSLSTGTCLPSLLLSTNQL